MSNVELQSVEVYVEVKDDVSHYIYGYVAVWNV